MRSQKINAIDAKNSIGFFVQFFWVSLDLYVGYSVTGHVIYNAAYTYKFQLTTTLESQHKGETYKTKRHKCTKCKKIFPTMWKLRTHLLTHSSPKKLSKRGDHEYAEEPSKKTSVQSMRKTVSDHPYANPADSTPAPATVQDESIR